MAATLWSNEIATLALCTSSFEVVICLRRIIRILEEISQEDRIKFCKNDFEKVRDLFLSAFLMIAYLHTLSFLRNFISL